MEMAVEQYLLADRERIFWHTMTVCSIEGPIYAFSKTDAVGLVA